MTATCTVGPGTYTLQGDQEALVWANSFFSCDHTMIWHIGLHGMCHRLSSALYAMKLPGGAPWVHHVCAVCHLALLQWCQEWSAQPALHYCNTVLLHGVHCTAGSNLKLLQ